MPNVLAAGDVVLGVVGRSACGSGCGSAKAVTLQSIANRAALAVDTRAFIEAPPCTESAAPTGVFRCARRWDSFDGGVPPIPSLAGTERRATSVQRTDACSGEHERGGTNFRSALDGLPIARGD